MYAATRLFNRRTIVGLALLLLIMAAAYGFAAANTVDVSSAGDGTGTISGYKISAVSYTLAAADPRNVSSVSFKIDDDAVPGNGMATLPTTIKIGFPASLGATPTAWITCTPPAALGGTATCAVTAPTVVKVFDINFLQVVAAN